MVPELVLQRAIVSGFQAIRRDPRVINNIFKTLPVPQQEAVKRFILEKAIDFSLNYPRTDIKVPAIVLLLKNESESNQFLGDLMGAPPNYDMPDQDMELDTLGGSAASISGSAGLPDKIVGSLQVQEMLPNRQSIVFTESAQEQLIEAFSERSNWPSLKLHVIAGAGAGQVKIISYISAERLDIADTFELNLDSSSLVDIRYADLDESVYGEPIRAYTNNTGLLRKGANYEVQYQLEILAGNQDEVIYLYSVLKAILFSQRIFLEEQGVMALRISGTDLAPRSELLPDEIFTRSMTIQFSYPFSFLVEQEVFSEIQIVFTSVDPTNPAPEPGSEIVVPSVLLSTSIQL